MLRASTGAVAARTRTGLRPRRPLAEPLLRVLGVLPALLPIGALTLYPVTSFCPPFSLWLLREFFQSILIE